VTGVDRIDRSGNDRDGNALDYLVLYINYRARARLVEWSLEAGCLGQRVGKLDGCIVCSSMTITGT